MQKTFELGRDEPGKASCQAVIGMKC